MRAMDYVDKLIFLASLINKIHRPCYCIFNNNKKNYRFKSDSHVDQ